MIRYSKILCVMAVALFCFLVAMGNSIDYSANFPGVARTLMVTDKFPDSNIGYRAITNPLLHHLVFLIVIALEALTAVLCMLHCVRKDGCLSASGQGLQKIIKVWLLIQTVLINQIKSHHIFQIISCFHPW